MKIFKITFLSILFIFVFSNSFSQNYKEVKIFLNDRSEITKLFDLGLEFDHLRYEKDNSITVFLSDNEFSILKNSGYRYDILIDDWYKHYANLPKMTENEKIEVLNKTYSRFNISGFDYGSMGGYYTLNEVYEKLDSMFSNYPNLITQRDSIGLSIEGRVIYVSKISDNPNTDENEPEALFTALHHAREPESMMQMIYFMFYLLENYGIDPKVTYLIDNREIYFIPVVNPDGYFWNQTTNPTGGGMWRKNRRNNGGSYGVDLNRNYGPYEYWNSPAGGSSTTPSSDTYRGTAPFSEPELQAIRNFLYGRDIRTCLNYHTYGNYLIHPWGAGMGLTPDSNIFREWASEMTQFNNYTFGTELECVGYGTRGNSDDYLYSGDTNNIGKIFAMTPEVGTSGDGFWPLQSRIIPLAEENLFPNLYLTWVAGEYVSLNSYHFKNLADPGDTTFLLVELKNKGLSDASDVSVEINSLSPSLSITNNSIYIGTISSQSIYNPADSFQIIVDTSAIIGQTYKLEVITYTSSVEMSCDTISIVIGKPKIVFEDPCDSLLEFWNRTSNNTNKWDTTSSSYYSEFYSYVESRTGNYLNNSTVEFTIKDEIDLTGISSPIFSFRTKYDIETQWDCGIVYISTDHGVTWNALEGNYTIPGSGYGKQIPAGIPVYDGLQNQWVLENIDLSPYSEHNIKIKFSFYSDEDVTRDGWYIDDIMIYYYGKNLSGIEKDKSLSYSLSQNYPNPFNPTTTIKYSVPFSPFSQRGDQVGFVTLKVFDILGQEVATLVNEEKAPGNYEVKFDAKDLVSGVYIYKLQAGEFISSKKMILLK